MRIAFISDIHGNLQALEAVLGDIGKSDVQATVCLGDVISQGLQPREVVELLQRLDCRFIMGNHDEPFVDYAKMAMLSVISEELFISNKWTFLRMSEEHLDFMHAFRSTIRLEDKNGRGILCFHGTPRCTHEGIIPETRDETVHSYLGGYAETVFVGGHTHRQMQRESRGRLLVNPGSVGSVFDDQFAKGQGSVLRPWAEYGILDLSGIEILFEMKKVPFDVQALRAVIAKTDFPYRDWWERQYSE